MPGANIINTIAEAIRLSAANENCIITFEFNGVIVNVSSDSKPELIYRDWLRAINGYIKKNIGPYPNPVLTDEEKANDDRIKAENERRQQERQAAYQAQATAKRNAVEAKLVNAPPMEVSDEEAWQEFKDKNQDSYGRAIVTYAERWARLMQAEMTTGRQIEEVAEATSREADLEDITGFMHGAAVSILAQYWKYGEQLRRWHNLYSQLGNEGELANESGCVLNPAVLNLQFRDQ